MAKLIKANKDEITKLKTENNQLMVKYDQMKANIQDLQKKFEELLKYSYNVDKFLFPPPENIKEHFKTVKGSCEFIEENAKIHPFFIPPEPFPYEGELLNGVPSGLGRVVYGEKYRYEGYFLNGRKHGPGKLILTDELGDLIQDQQHYHGKRIGLFKAIYSKMKSFYFDCYGIDGLKSHVSMMWQPESKELTFYQQNNNEYHGLAITIDLETLKIHIESFKKGIKENIFKKNKKNLANLPVEQSKSVKSQNESRNLQSVHNKLDKSAEPTIPDPSAASLPTGNTEVIK